MQELIEVSDRNGFGPGHDIIASGGAVQQVRSAFCTAVAVQRPRILKDVARRVQEEAALAGEDFYYGWRAGADAIEGPSVKMAMCIARNWGNCAVDTLPVQDLPDCWIFTAAFVDLETGFTLTRQFRQSKDWKVHGKLDEERKADVRFQIGQSKAVRNVILNAIPSSLVSRALEAAKQGVRDELDKLIKEHGFAKVADRLISALSKAGVKEYAVLAKCGVADRKGLGVDHLVVLRGDLNALQNGQERAEVLFPAVEQKQGAAEPDLNAHWKNQLQGLAENLRKDEEAGVVRGEQPKKAKPASKKTLKELKALFDKLVLTPPEIDSFCKREGIESVDDLSEEAAERCIKEFAEHLREQEQKQAQREPGEDELE